MSRNGRKRKGWIARPPRPRDLEGARQLAGQALRILETIPPDLAKDLADELYFSKVDIEQTLNVPLRCVVAGNIETGLLGVRPPKPHRDRRQSGTQIFREIRSQPKPRVSPPGCGRPGYVKELVVKYRFRPLPYGARLVGGRIVTSRDVFEMFRNLRYEPREHIMILHMDGGERVISVDHVATGTQSECPFSASLVFRDAMLAGAAGIIIIHNHPTGRPEPSQDDLALMDDAKRTGQLLRIPVMDFIIIGDEKYWSASDRGLLLSVPRAVPPTAPAAGGVNREKPGRRTAAVPSARRGKP